MPNHPVVPIKDLGHRLPEQGRIRIGVKTTNPKNPMKAIDTFRFTSADREAIDQIAALYGGDVRAWHDSKANPPDQFEVITGVKKIRVFLPPECMSIFYEQWGGGGVVRRCDGVTVEVAGQDDMIAQPCICAARNNMQCKPYSRISVVLPEVRPFGGAWRLETKGWNAAKELPTFTRMIEQLQARGIVEARLRLDQETRMVRGRKTHFVVPRLEVGQSADGMIEGAARAGALGPGSGTVVERPAITAVSSADGWDDDEPIDATLVEDELLDRFSVLTAELAASIEPLLDQEDGRSIVTDVRRALSWGATQCVKEDARTLTEFELERAVGGATEAAKDLTGLVAYVKRWRSERPL